MTSIDFQILLEAMGSQCPVRPSARIEDAVDIEIDGTLVSAQWVDDAGLIELTVDLPVVLEDADHPAVLLSLFRALLERQWLETGGDQGVSFGLMPSSNEVVGMVALSGEAITGPDSLLAALQQATVSVLGEWYGLCGQILLLQQGATPAERPALLPSSPYVSV
jgi:hypothetical protein